MARGYPDFFAQAIVPRYGTAYTQSAVMVFVPAATEVNAYTLAAKGRIYGGYCEMINVVLPNSIWIKVTIDGQLAINRSLYELLLFNIPIPEIAPIFIRVYDIEHQRYVIGITSDYVFEQTYVLSIDNADALNPLSASGDLYYTLIL